MRASIALLFALALSAVFPAAQTRTVKTLDIYVVDVEGGNATLFVSPSKVSALTDGSFTVANGRNRFSKTYSARFEPGTN